VGRVSLYINWMGTGNGAGSSAYRFDAQLTWGTSEGRENTSCVPWQRLGLANSSISFTTTTGWQGNALNDDSDDRGWVARIRIPFASLGLSSAPAQGVVWGMALALHDRDDAPGQPSGEDLPEDVNTLRPESWAR